MHGRLQLSLGFAAFWLVCAVVSVFSFQGMITIGTMRLSAPIPLSRVVVMQGAPWAATALLTPVIALFVERVPFSGPQRLRAIGLHLTALVALSVVYTTLVLTLMAPLDAHTRVTARAVWTRYVSSAGVFLTEYALVAGVVEAVRYRQDARSRAEQAERLALKAAELERDLTAARLVVLQQQLQPHFLFNALNAASSLVDEHPVGARQLLSRLGDLLRATLNRSGAGEVPLGDELEFTDRYVAVEQARFGDRLHVRYEIDDDTLGAPVPAFLLQPLVENAVRHGFARLAEGGTIAIGARRAGERLRVWVRNDAPADSVLRPGGVGLTQARARIAGLYGDRGCFEAGFTKPGEFAVHVELPWTAGGETRA